MSEQDVADLARLHLAALPDSLVSLFGEAYVRAFYRFVDRSTREILAVQRGPDARICAAGVISLAPQTFERRLLLSTTLAWHALVRLPAVARSYWEGWRRPRHPRGPARDGFAEPGLPELLLAFTDARFRSQGHGAAVLREAERQLAERRVAAYQVRTVREASNRAIVFYQANGFTPVGVSRRLGTDFQVFVKAIRTA